MPDENDNLLARASDLEAARDRILGEMGEIFDLLLAQSSGDRNDRLVRLASRFQDERDRARLRSKELESEVEALTLKLEDAAHSHAATVLRAHNDLIAATQRGDNLAAAVRAVVNSPTSPDRQRQGKLLVAIQEYDA